MKTAAMKPTLERNRQLQVVDCGTEKIPITVILAVRNESANLPRCLEALEQFESIVVIDSHSSDDSALIARGFGAQVKQFRYGGGYPRKRQWALDNVPIDTDWIMLLDADEVLPPALVEEIRYEISEPNAPNAFFITKGFHFLGKRFRFGGFSHAAVMLFRKGTARFENLLPSSRDALDMEVHERLIVEGRIGRLKTPLVHQDFKGLQAYIDRHNQYSTWEACVRQRFLSEGAWGESAIRARLLGNAQERRRFLKKIAVRMPGEPFMWFLYHYVFRGGFLEGRRGLIASQIRAQYIANVRSKIFEMSLEEQSQAVAERPAVEVQHPARVVTKA